MSTTAINDEWEMSRSPAELDFDVYAIKLDSGEQKARASFLHLTEAESYAMENFRHVGPDWGMAVVKRSTDFVLWTSF